jgi:ferrous iron transport protein B
VASTATRAASPASLFVRRTPRVVLVGNPNTGKTTLFNALCGARAKTSNFPGTTTTRRTGRAELADGTSVEVLDIPGIYELHLDAAESRIAREVLANPNEIGLAVVLVDASNLTRSLVLAGEMLGHDIPIVVVLNMIDLAQRRGLTVNTAVLSRRLGAPVVPMIARRGDGLDPLKRAIATTLTAPRSPRPADLPRGVDALDQLSTWADDVLREAASGADDADIDTFTERLDAAFTHPILGLLAFVATMAGLFWTLFALATVPMDLIEATFAGLGDLTRALLPEGPLRDLLTEGVIGGVAGTVVFLPQICLLFFLISLLEDTGYLARAAFVMDRVLHRFGLPGHAFVPLLTAHACAIPGIMSARLIPDRRDRLATILVAPFMSCSARLPVYVLLTSLLFADRPALAGLAFAGCYVLGGSGALFSAWLFGRTWLKGRARPMILELPSYKVPSLTNALLAAKDQGLAFLRTAGTVIIAICIVMWWLSAYPRVENAAATSGSSVVVSEDAAQQSASYAGQIGRTLQPAFAPLGYDWQLTVGVLTSFMAREVFVSTMAVLAGTSGDAEVDEGVIDRIRTMRRDDGTPVFTVATAASALIFFVLAMQCLPTLAVTAKESGSFKFAAIQLAYMSSLAYAAAFTCYQVLRLSGVS